MIGGKEEADPSIANETFGAFQIRVVLLCALVALLDGFDTQSIAFAAPVIGNEWRLELASFAGVFAAGLLGGLGGAVVIGRLADRMGRKPAMVLALAIMGAGSLIAPFAEDRLLLGASRFIAGIGMGGALPCAIALTTEYVPLRLRASITTAMFCAFPFGAIVGAIASGPVLQAGDWRALFWVGGLTPLAMIPFVWRWVPESIGWLRQRGQHAAVAKITRAMGVPSLPEHLPSAATEEGEYGSLSAIVAEGRLGVTMLLGMAFLVSLLLVYLLVNWVPSLTVATGGDAALGARATALLNLAGIVGGLIIAVIGDRTDTPRAIAFAYIAGAVGCGALSLLAPAVSSVFLLCAVAGLLCVGAQMCLVSVAAAIYPLHLRAGAIGLMMAMGRVGAVIGPLVGGALIGGSDGYFHLALCVAVGCLIAGAAIAVLPRRA